jgi:hypothetical protein
MSATRRTFVAGLAGLLGAPSIPVLRNRVLDAGHPILVKPTGVTRSLHIYERGVISLGEYSHDKDLPLHQRPPWRDLWRLEGHNVDDPEVLADLVESYAADGPDHPIDDPTWFDAVDITLGSCARASRLLKELNIGPEIRTLRSQIGRLDFYHGNGAPGSNDTWVEAGDDLSVTLLQAQLITEEH